MTHLTDCSCGRIKGNEREDCYEYLGVRFARAGRFEYPVPVDSWQGEYDATNFGNSCPQMRWGCEHLENPKRLFYHNEYRKNQVFSYDEDCLNMNIYTPKNAENCPVIVFFHGGGFNSGSNMESSFDGAAFARKGIILCTVNYRVGVFGYLTHEDIKAKCGHEGNFGMYDQICGIEWVKRHIASFGGDSENITLLGQSAGAISIQYLCLMKRCKGLFRRAVMMSGGGLFPDFALPRRAEDTHAYWLDLMQEAGVHSLDELKAIEPKQLIVYMDRLMARRKDNQFNTMPVIDGELLPESVKELIKKPLPLDYIIGFTNNDMFAPAMAYIGTKFARANNGYLYYFDIDAPGGDRNAAFHSSDLRYMFGTLSRSHRPYSEHDYLVSDRMISYVSNFARCGNPNGEGLPHWDRKKVLCFRPGKTAHGIPNYIKMTYNMLTIGDPT